MSTINVLDDKTINMIAAGEVVERPVNVVKELVENAIDAGSANISIEIKSGGAEYIRVTDNGCGIERESIPLAFCRHATSKISSIEDLLSITSLGFRGEALSSIAAVSKVELMTRQKGALLGYRYRIDGGRELFIEEAGVPEGTTVIVRNLFYNTPARLKFLKSAVTEGGYITELVERLILSHPGISFKYVVNGTMKLSSSGMGDTEADLYSVFGRDAQKSLVEVSLQSENCSVSGFVGKPEIARGNRNFEIFFVNGRFIKSRILSSAVEESYKAFLMQHRFPFVVLYLDIPSELIDVNVHPAKTEIKFLEEQSVYDTVHKTVLEGITKRELIPDVQPLEARDDDTSEIEEVKEKAAFPVYEPFETRKIENSRQIAKDRIINENVKSEPVQETLFKEGFLGEEARAKHRIIGQVFDTFWIIEYDGKMYIVDQHAAHEKVLYERFSKQISENAVMSQMISPPYILSLSSSEEETVKQYLDVFEETGFHIEHFGGREYAISSVPTELFRLGELEYFRTLLDDLSGEHSCKELPDIKDRIATMACKAAVKGNMRMSTAEADALIDELLSLDNPYNCPHGRPTIIAYSRSDLEKMFKRIV
ncbi:MAG: DNA mismatch repair endonuclease MutL [Lachnospiraceae bacterium]|nr:DNA mismatch repair endonuclease MutL [Lachnospiraceae bacterium]